MNEDIEEMINIYDTRKIDWIGDSIKTLSDLTRHHIVKKQYGGDNSVNNYALLTTSSHHFIHEIETKYNKEYIYINNLFMDLNESKNPPDKDYYDKILPVIKRIRKRIKNEKRKNR